MTGTPRDRDLPGALVISLDFELHWGIRDHRTAEDARDTLLGARAVVPRLLDLFEEYEAAATWATVGFLFARGREELDRFRPTVLPRYENPALDPYQEPVGADEGSDPLHFAPSLVEQIRRTSGQEIGTHTFSHYFCCEPGQGEESFRADIEAAVAIAGERGIRIRSIVFPRNQLNPDYDAVLLENGITAYRGNPPSWMWRFESAAEAGRWWLRLGRGADTFLPLGRQGLTPWDQVLRPSGLSDVSATQLIRAQIPQARLRTLHVNRIRGLLRQAARSRRIVHLWWHPHNFGRFQERSLRMLRAILEEYTACGHEHGMVSLNMAGVDELARYRFGVTTGREAYANAD